MMFCLEGCLKQLDQRRLNMAVTLGTIASALLGYSNKFGTEGQGSMSTNVVGLILLPISVLMVMYATWSFHRRTQMIRRREDGPFDDVRLPIILAIVLVLGLWIIFLVSLVNYIRGRN
mmetsp:Transcript_9989/g.25413  ORF Transcript_9989/g.25413 Transcript_9989/m.25413 type:complete len:118 (-) Transcript_9989:358-711(-)